MAATDPTATGSAPGTVAEQFERTVEQCADRPAMREKRDGSWHTTTWREYRDEVMSAARGMIALGLEPGMGVAIMGFNRREWFVADLAAIFAGGLPAGIYTTLTQDQAHYVADHCEAAVAVVENRDYLEIFLGLRDRLPHLRAIVLMEGETGEEGVFAWDELLGLAERTPDATLRARMAAQRPDDPCTLIYTSGTTGPSKAVMISHHNILWVARAATRGFDFTPDDQLLSYLPLSHIAEQVVTLHGPMRVGACSWFAESIERLPQNLREVRPTIFFAVPRVWEKMQSAIETVGAKSGGLKRMIGRWARRKGLAAGYAFQRGEPQPPLVGLADKLVFSKVRAALGFDRTKVCITSAAPISLDTLDFFQSFGIPILEVYGMSECTGPATISLPSAYRLGRAGRPIEGTEIAIAADGEILIRGPHVFKGYYKDAKATAETVDAEGWIHSGDVGDLDGDGYLRVTDRKKELIITSGGKNVAPAPIEAQLKTIPLVAQAAVVGDRRNYLAALLTLDAERLPREAAEAGSRATTPEEACACPKLLARLEEQLERVNSKLARYEGIKRFRLLPRQFTVEGGELTPTMKLKRRVIAKKYGGEIEDLYRAAEAST